MKTKNHIYFFIIILISLFLGGCSTKIKPSPDIKGGIYDLRSWNFQNDGYVSLDGNWQFFDSVILSPSELETSSVLHTYAKVPSVRGVNSPSTYRLKILLNNSEKVLGIFVSNFQDYNIWINGVNKMPDTDWVKDTLTVNSINIADFIDIKSGTVDIVVHAYDFNPKDILLGTKEQILNFKYKNFTLSLPIIFIILFMGFYHLMIFLFRRKEKPYLYTALYSFAAAVYTSCLPKDPPLFFLFPNLNKNVYNLIFEINTFMVLLFIITYLDALYPNIMHRKIVLSAKIISMVFISSVFIIYILNKWSYAGILIKTYNIIFVISSLYVVYFLLKIQRKNKDALLILFGLAILFITDIMDIIYKADKVYTNLNKFGWFIFITILSVRLAINFTKTFTKVEHLSEKLLILDKLKDDFLVNTAHELKTPMHGIIGIAESMLDESIQKSSKDSENLSLIVSCARRLTELVNNIMDFAKMKNSDIVLNLKTINLWQIVDLVFAVLRPVSREKDLILKNAVNDESINVYADENRLFQIMYNLVGNALKFTERGSITAEASVKDGFVEISVSDTGIGIPHNMLEKIFVPFEQVQDVESITNTGTGLGLSITKKLVELHGGTIWAESCQTESNSGSKFIFTLQLSLEKSENNKFIKSSANIETVMETAAASVVNNKNSKEKEINILVADDEPVNLRILQNMFRKEEYNIITATNGQNALEAIDGSTKPDIAILDVMMPRMSGYDVCRKLREKYEMYDLPILLVTVKNQPADILAGFEAGANDYLTKPFNDKELKARIQNLLEVKKSIDLAVAAEMNFLQAQIKPHFLYNTLNVIMSLIRTDPEKSRELLFELSSFLRETFKFKGIEKSISLKKEINMVKSYIYIMTARYPTKILTEYDIDDVDQNVPHLIIQPIVENSIKHGILPKREGGTIFMRVKDMEDHIFVSVEDDGNGIPNELIPVLLNENTKTTGIGLVNVNKRLITCFGSGLNIESEMGKGTKIYFKIPKGIKI
ncbi:hybrid sensor histidine kinase/response regulator [Pseudobacteroides cellulosolvens]|nr:ATP-binding protein [Pseudobacteroides cellulosolvens]